MLDNAIKKYPNLRFEKCFVSNELDKINNYDLFFSNACLYWVPNHTIFFQR